MPLHLNDMDLASEIEGQSSALILPCYMCPAVTVPIRENKTFLQLLSHFLKSPLKTVGSFQSHNMKAKGHLE